MPIAVSPDFTLLLWLILLSWLANGLVYIYVGATHTERKSTYGAFDVLWGIGTLVLVLLVLAL